MSKASLFQRLKLEIKELWKRLWKQITDYTVLAAFFLGAATAAWAHSSLVGMMISLGVYFFLSNLEKLAAMSIAMLIIREREKNSQEKK